ncbi:MAG: metallopeptidase family protein [Jatrophihabitans sp.]
MLQVSPERFEELIGEALDRIPPELMKELNNVVIRAADQHPENPHLLGLYHGVDLTRRTHDYTWAMPDEITIYRLPLLRICGDEDELAHQVAVTVVHEVGHHFGIDDARLHELGWG